MRSKLTAGFWFVDVGCIRVEGEDNFNGLVGDSIVGVGSHIIKELVDSGHCVLCGCGLLGAY